MAWPVYRDKTSQEKDCGGKECGGHGGKRASDRSRAAEEGLGSGGAGGRRRGHRDGRVAGGGADAVVVVGSDRRRGRVAVGA